jgi:hypothetical protein
MGRAVLLHRQGRAAARPYRQSGYSFYETAINGKGNTLFEEAATDFQEDADGKEPWKNGVMGC